MRSEGGILIGVGLVTSVAYKLGSKIVVYEDSGGRNLVGLAGGETDVADLRHEDLM